MVMTTGVLLGSLYLSLVGGDVVAKEVEDGTMRMTLCRPVSRARIIALKYIACVIYTFALVFYIGTTALAAGVLFRGTGGLFVYAPMQKIVALYELQPGLERYFLALPMLALSLTTVTSLAFMFSCFNMKPAAATIITLSVIILDLILHDIPAFESLHPYFLSTHMSAWLQTFVPYTSWWSVLEDYAYLIALDATFLVVALAVFQNRDFKA
jgi:ABC-2 type transport system permease protein